MTKLVRIENADTSDHQVVVEIWEKKGDRLLDSVAPDTLVETILLAYPTAMTGQSAYLTSTRYMIIKEATNKVE